eukprot:759695-Heterocapsa_arctica.AAC.1
MAQTGQYQCQGSPTCGEGLPYVLARHQQHMKRVLAFSAVNLSLVARALTWNVDIITIISYIAMRLAITPEVAKELWAALRMHMKCSWWIKIGDSTFIAGTIRLDG